MYGYIYITTNLLNGRKYIGQKKSEFFDETYFGSGKILKQAILKEGIENFECHILEEKNGVPTICNSEEELNYAEEYYIEYYMCVESPDYYNLKPGGLGKSQKGLTYLRNPKTGRCKKVPYRDVEKFLSEGYILGGPKQSEETKRKRAEANRGQHRNAEQRENIARSHRGVALSEDHKKSLRKPKSVTSWKKGKIGMTNGQDIVFIIPAQYDEYVNKGYRRGTKRDV